MGFIFFKNIQPGYYLIKGGFIWWKGLSTKIHTLLTTNKIYLVDIICQIRLSHFETKKFSIQLHNNLYNFLAI